MRSSPTSRIGPRLLISRSGCIRSLELYAGRARRPAIRLFVWSRRNAAVPPRLQCNISLDFMPYSKGLLSGEGLNTAYSLPSFARNCHVIWPARPTHAEANIKCLIARIRRTRRCCLLSTHTSVRCDELRRIHSVYARYVHYSPPRSGWPPQAAHAQGSRSESQSGVSMPERRRQGGNSSSS